MADLGPWNARGLVSPMAHRHELSVKHAVRNDLDDVARVWHANALEMDGRPYVPVREGTSEPY